MCESGAVEGAPANISHIFRMILRSIVQHDAATHLRGPFFNVSTAVIFQASHGIKNGSLFDPFIIQTDTFQTSGMEKEAGGRQITHNRVIMLYFRGVRMKWPLGRLCGL